MVVLGFSLLLGGCSVGLGFGGFGFGVDFLLLSLLDDLLFVWFDLVVYFDLSLGLRVAVCFYEFWVG